MLLHQILEHKRFCIDESIAFDFSNESPITFVEFLNFPDGRDLEHMVKSRSKYLGVNTVLVTGGSSDKSEFRHNLDGIKGLAVWQDPYYIGTFIKELLLKHNSKYNIFYGDCAGGYTALIASRHAPVHTLFLSSPTINASALVDQNIHEHDIPGIEYRSVLEDTINVGIGVLDAFPILVKNVEMGVKISIHWSKNSTGSDLYEKNRVLQIPKKLNLEIVEHTMPLGIDQHHLAQWLSNTHQLRTILQQEIQYAKMAISSHSV